MLIEAFSNNFLGEEREAQSVPPLISHNSTLFSLKFYLLPNLTESIPTSEVRTGYRFRERTISLHQSFSKICISKIQIFVKL